jgi:hypothetical protein
MYVFLSIVSIEALLNQTITRTTGIPFLFGRHSVNLKGGTPRKGVYLHSGPGRKNVTEARLIHAVDFSEGAEIREIDCHFYHIGHGKT